MATDIAKTCKRAAVVVSLQPKHLAVVRMLQAVKVCFNKCVKDYLAVISGIL